LAAHLQQNGFAPRTADLMRLEHLPPRIAEVEGLKIIPSRASFRHARQLAEQAAQRYTEPTLADAAMLRLDDPHWDSLIALRDGQAVAHIAVLAVGEIGRIDDVYVAQDYRRLGIGRTMMSRALEICARSLFKHVMLMVNPTNDAAKSLYQSLGFNRVGEVTAYRRGDAI
jgi:ribosomal protein S18 acetylase RimI-like enzyme